ncbi:MAG TPA: response regulator [Spirochaetes bacterium]|nr:response regulator [Spirochaetota bacterium]
MAKFPEYPVLIVDDEDHVLRVLGRVLGADGINNVITCNDSMQATKIIEQKKISVLILDLNMPYLSGEELMRMVRVDHPEQSIAGKAASASGVGERNA